MEKFIDYIERSLPSNNGNDILYKFKRHTLEEMTLRANEITARGISDKNVVSDLIISEYPDLTGMYHKYYEEKTAAKKAKRAFIINTAGSAIYIFLLIVSFLTVSFATGAWGQTWLIIVNGICLWVCYLLALGAKKLTSMRRFLHPLARLMLGGCVMIFFVTVFLFCLIVLKNYDSWIIVIAGIAMMFISDCIYIKMTGQKLAIISYLVYIPAIAAMLYIILGGSGMLAWSVGWVIIPLSLIADAVVIFAAIAKNSRVKEEVEDIWKES